MTLTDLTAANSGYEESSYCPSGIPVETALFALLGAFAVAFAVLYTTLTMLTAMDGRRKRRSSSSSMDAFDLLDVKNESPLEKAFSLLLFGRRGLDKTLGLLPCLCSISATKGAFLGL